MFVLSAGLFFFQGHICYTIFISHNQHFYDLGICSFTHLGQLRKPYVWLTLISYHANWCCSKNLPKKKIIKSLAAKAVFTTINLSYLPAQLVPHRGPSNSGWDCGRQLWPAAVCFRHRGLHERMASQDPRHDCPLPHRREAGGVADCPAKVRCALPFFGGVYRLTCKNCGGSKPFYKVSKWTFGFGLFPPVWCPATLFIMATTPQQHPLPEPRRPRYKRTRLQ